MGQEPANTRMKLQNAELGSAGLKDSHYSHVRIASGQGLVEYFHLWLWQKEKKRRKRVILISDDV